MRARLALDRAPRAWARLGAPRGPTVALDPAPRAASWRDPRNAARRAGWRSLDLGAARRELALDPGHRAAGGSRSTRPDARNRGLTSLRHLPSVRLWVCVLPLCLV